jgi:carboxynorspermidine decarboxylase
MKLSKELKWINLGGGHHITRKDYEIDKLKKFLKKIAYETNCQIYIEPGEAVVLDAGILIGEIIDYFKPSNHLSPAIAITDISATSHIPDVIEAPYRPALLNEPTEGHKVLLGGPSCLAGDNLGIYNFDKEPTVGERIVLLDQAHYTMVKTNFFNGVKMPSIAIWDSKTNDIDIIKEFSYEDFENKLS